MIKLHFIVYTYNVSLRVLHWWTLGLVSNLAVVSSAVINTRDMLIPVTVVCECCSISKSWKLWVNMCVRESILSSVRSLRINHSLLFTFLPPQAGTWVQSSGLRLWQTAYCYLDLVVHVPVYTLNPLFPVPTLGPWLQQEFSSTDLFPCPRLFLLSLSARNPRFYPNICCVSVYTASSLPVHCYTWAGKDLSGTRNEAMPTYLRTTMIQYWCCY